jgi:phytoene dehydrogenase-like protein
MQTKTDVVVIGAGLAGLTAAVAAAAGGARVTVLEAHVPGGRAATIDRDGFRLNEGPHALYEGGPAETFLSELGVPLTGGAPTGPFYGRVGDDVDLLPVSASTLARTHLLSGRSKLRLARVMQNLAKVDAAAHRHETASAWLTGLGLPDDAAGVVRALTCVATYSDLLDDLSADAAISQLQGGLRGVRYLDGGWQRLVDGVEAAAVAAGAEIQAQQAVTTVRSVIGGFEINGPGSTMVAGAVVVAAGGAATAARLLGTSTAAMGWDGRLGPPSSVSCLDLGLTAPASCPVLFGIDQPLYFSTHSPPADLAPTGHTLVSLLRYLPADDTATADEERATLLAHAQVAGVDLRRIVMQRFLRRMTAVTAVPIPAAGGLGGRPGVEVPDRPGAFVAGDWVGAVGMLADATIASAREAGRRAAQHTTTTIRDGQSPDFVGTASPNARIAT